MRRVQVDFRGCGMTVVHERIPAPPALDPERLRRLAVVVLAGVNTTCRARFQALVDDALDRMELAAALDDAEAAANWGRFVRRRLDAWVDSSHVRTEGTLVPLTDTLLRQWRRAEEATNATNGVATKRPFSDDSGDGVAECRKIRHDGRRGE